MSDNCLPFDMQEEIMKKLPLTSLIRFRSVSKAWMSLISFKFLAKLDNVHQPRRQFICYSPDDSHHYYHTFDDETFPQFNFTLNPTIGQKPTSALPELIPQRECRFSLINSRPVGSSHGLLCFYDFRKKFIIWNPSIGKSIAIVVPSRPTTAPRTGLYYVVGFGVCPFSLDPKIIMIPHCFDQEHSTFRISRVEVKVFSLSSCAWAPSINLPRETVRLEQNSEQVIDGFIYWLAYDNYKVGCDNPNLIISFDLTSEEFSEIHLPESLKLGCLYISKLRETLVILEYNKVTFNEIQLHAVWMMDNDAFTRLYTIDTPATSLILGFRKTGAMIIVRLVVVDNDDKQVLATYEPDSKQITEIGVFDSECSFSVYSYMETQLLIDQPDGTIYDHCKEKTLRKRKASNMVC